MQMGIGNVGAPGVIFKRKFRWTFSIQTPVGNIGASFVKVAARPKLAIDPTEIRYLNQTTWIPGRPKWEPISVKYIDVPALELQGLWNWIATIYNFVDPQTKYFNANPTMSEKAGWYGVGTLNLYDGCGTPLETWALGSMWPDSVDFGELDYQSSDEVTIDLSLRYSEVAYFSLCGPNPVAFCAGC